jgi:hypothetical protein
VAGEYFRKGGKNIELSYASLPLKLVIAKALIPFH